ncbi:hypothetical protein Acr_12g0003320 [Actinidia rufa]|uniref:Retrotransposon gag domain-containing protein n=1 Tax=Actinidia rufa TaxID=165716 RepID=A0A7J0FGH3_9ERIC|nr:hypothetical protein Acr_12g0003320 [Actinidia rufa]
MGGHDEAPQIFHFTPEALREFVWAIRDEIQQPPPPPPVVVEPVVHRASAEPRAQSAMREFIRQNPPRFSREPDLIKAESWLKRINLAFEMIELNEDVLYIREATHQFLGRALTWWDMVKTTHNVEMMTWVDFECVFLDYYFSQVVHNAKRREFLALKQGDLSLVQYGAQFNNLARFTPESISTDYLRARCFERLSSTKRRKKPRWIGILVLLEKGLIQCNNSRGKGRSICSDNNSLPILNHSSLNSRGLPLSTSLEVHISQVHPEVDLVKGQDFATSVDKRATSRLFAHNFRHRDKISSLDNHSLGISPLVLPF